MASHNPHESPDLEGLPDEVEDSPPGKDIELDEEGVMLPRDRPVAAGSGRAYPVTAAEQSRPESAAARHAREQPDFGEPEATGPAGEPTGAAGEAAAEEAAMEVLSEDDLPAGKESAD